MFIRTNWLERTLLLVAGFALAYSGTFFDLLGFGLLIAAVVMQQLRGRRVVAGSRVG